MVSEKITADQMTIEDFAKARACQHLVKNMLKGITLIVIQTKTNSTNAQGQQQWTKQQEEQSYFSFIEDLCKYSFKDKANISMLMVIKSIMNKNFISTTSQERVVKGIRNFTD